MKAFKTIALRGTILSCSVLALASMQAHAADCMGRFCVGTWVIDSDNNVAQLVGFKDSNTGRYQVYSSIYEAPLSRLSPEVPELNGLKPQVKIIDSENIIGVAIHVFEDGRVQYQYGNNAYVTRSASPEVSAHGFIRKGTLIIETDDLIGKAEAVFANGKVQYKYGNNDYVTSNAVAETTEINGLKKLFQKSLSRTLQQILASCR